MNWTQSCEAHIRPTSSYWRKAINRWVKLVSWSQVDEKTNFAPAIIATPRRIWCQCMISAFTTRIVQDTMLFWEWQGTDGFNCPIVEVKKHVSRVIDSETMSRCPNESCLDAQHLLKNSNTGFAIANKFQPWYPHTRWRKVWSSSQAPRVTAHARSSILSHFTPKIVEATSNFEIIDSMLFTTNHIVTPRINWSSLNLPRYTPLRRRPLFDLSIQISRTVSGRWRSKKEHDVIESWSSEKFTGSSLSIRYYFSNFEFLCCFLFLYIRFFYFYTLLSYY